MQGDRGRGRCENLLSAADILPIIVAERYFLVI